MHRKSRQNPDDAALLELFKVIEQRWALHVLWQLRDGGLTYRELAARIPGMSTSVLTDRLRELRVAALVEHERKTGYRLSSHGRDLMALLEPLQEWAGQCRERGSDQP
jgi:DNA-binding HxlR family transcriptional regulator